VAQGEGPEFKPQYWKKKNDSYGKSKADDLVNTENVKLTTLLGQGRSKGWGQEQAPEGEPSIRGATAKGGLRDYHRRKQQEAHDAVQATVRNYPVPKMHVLCQAFPKM
jgi:hypothetical protein